MNIIESLSRDMGAIFQLELTNPRFNRDRFSIHLLLLIGHRRHVKMPLKPTASVQTSISDDEDEPDGAEDQEDEVNLRRDNVVQISAFKNLQQQVKSFRYANPYLKKLLFRDFQNDGESDYEDLCLGQFGTIRIHNEAVRYVSEVLLLRPLQLARKNGDKPTNMHLLFKTLCRFSITKGNWFDTKIARSYTATQQREIWFEKIAKRLQENFEGQGDKICATASNRRKLSGPYWLTAGNCSEKIAEELSLQDVLSMVPTPLSEGFANNPDFADLLKGCIDSLNMRYRCLRSAGLPPEDWLQAEKPSIEELKKLARLRKRAITSEQWTNGNIEAAFEQAFSDELNAMKAKSKKADGKIAGFMTFAEFKDSHIGDTFINRSTKRMISLSDFLEDGMGDFELDDESQDIATTVEAAVSLETLLQEAGSRLSEKPILVSFFREAFIGNRALFDRNGLFEDIGFLALLKNDPRYVEFADNAIPLAEALHTAALSVQEQQALREQLRVLNEQMQAGEKLFFEVRQLLFEVLIERNAIDIPPVLYEYIRQVVIEEKPARGTDGLFNKKAFKKLLAEDAFLSALAPEELIDEIEKQAIKVLAALFQKRA